jgi:hypothetical protein
MIQHVCVLNFTSLCYLFVLISSFWWFINSHDLFSLSICEWLWERLSLNICLSLTWSRSLSVWKTRVQMFLIVSIMWKAPCLDSFILFNMIKNGIKGNSKCHLSNHFLLLFTCAVQKDIVLSAIEHSIKSHMIVS